MILRTQGQMSKDEAELGTFLAANIGVADAQDLARMLWETAEENPQKYMFGLAQIVRGVHAHGPKHVSKLLDLARKPADVRAAEIELNAWSVEKLKVLCDRILKYPDDLSAPRQCWNELGEALRVKVAELFPKAKDYVRDGAVLRFATWDKEKGQFSVDAGGIVQACMRPDPLAPQIAQAGV